MVNPNKGRALLPMPVIEAARAGDAEAVERVLRYYEGYINYPHECVDEYMKHLLEIKLIHAIVAMN